ncbi:MAG: TIGR01777 family oxidoreductase [Streptomycetaceae bacterium]|nr:TIGR01777 family oxidoreductase [Streptomycetaceae bacterium]
MRIAVTGSTGLIGSALVRALRSDSHNVVRLVRRTPGAPDEAEWDPKRSSVDTTALEGCEVMVHLAGAGVGDHRWTPRYKQEIRDSRVLGTTTIAKAIASLTKPPRVLVSASAVGYYGDTGEHIVDESAPPGTGFLARICQDWEAATAAARNAGVRTVMARTGLVVASGGGAWGKLFPLFKAGLGGRLGSGRQYWSFIALPDHIAALRHLIDTETLSGPVNLTAPEPVTNAEATAAMGRVLHRPTVATVPAPVLRIALGDFAQEILVGQRAIPRRLLDSGFSFTFPRIDDAIRAALDDRA